jgi:hypothetical protein
LPTQAEFALKSKNFNIFKKPKKPLRVKNFKHPSGSMQMSSNVNINTYIFCPSLKKKNFLAQAQFALTHNFRKRNLKKNPKY